MFTKVLVLALLYFVTAKLGLLLAIPPGYATAIWPPTGMALVFVLLYGPWMGVGIFIGSFTINFTNPDASGLVQSILIPSFIGLGAVLNALSTSKIIQRWIGFPNAIEEPNDIFKFILIGGPLGCSISAIIGSTTLLYFNVIKQASYFENCFTWWVGDVIGVIVFAPVLLLVKQWINKKTLKKIPIITVPLFLALTITIFTFVYISKLEQNKIDKNFKEDVNQLSQSIESSIKHQEDILNYIKYYFENSKIVTREEFQGFTSKILLTNPEIKKLEWVPFISTDKRYAFEKGLNSEGFKKIKLTQNKDFYLPIHYIEPLEKNRDLIGHDISVNNLHSADLNKAMLSGKPIATYSSHLTAKIFNPLFKKDSKTFGIKNIYGYLVGEINLEHTVTNLTIKGIEYNIIYDSDLEKSIFDKNKKLNNFSQKIVKEISVPGKTWILEAIKTNDYALMNKSWATWFVLVGGLLFTALMEIILLIIIGKSNQIERIVLQKTADLVEANNEIKKVSVHKSEFLANMSHEIRTPMNGIIGMTDLIINRNKLDKDDLNSLEIIKDCSITLLTIINDILDYSKVEAGKMVAEKINFSLPKLVQAVLRIFNQEATSKNIRLNLAIAEDVPEGVRTDEIRLKQIINNLISNSLKFTLQGEITVSVSVKNRLPNNRYDILFQIKDTGIGISKNAQTKLFSAFTQADTSTTRKYGGTGLGLAICKKLSQLLGGDIELSSTLGKGSLFSFNIIAEKVELTNTDQIENTVILNSDLASLCPLNILIVEDNLVNQKIAVKILGKLGYQPDLAVNGLEAIESLQYKKFDLIFMDMQMPIMDGIEATKKIRELYPEQKIVIVAMTANVFQEDKEKCLQAGMDDFTTKPINFNKLQSIISKVFNLKTKTRKIS